MTEQGEGEDAVWTLAFTGEDFLDRDVNPPGTCEESAMTADRCVRDHIHAYFCCFYLKLIIMTADQWYFSIEILL